MFFSLVSCTLSVASVRQGQVLMPGSWAPYHPSCCLEPHCISDTPSLFTPLGTLFVTTPPNIGRQEQREPQERTWNSILCKCTNWHCAEKGLQGDREDNQEASSQGDRRRWSCEAGSGPPGGGVDRMYHNPQLFPKSGCCHGSLWESSLPVVPPFCTVSFSSDSKETVAML